VGLNPEPCGSATAGGIPAATLRPSSLSIDGRLPVAACLGWKLKAGWRLASELITGAGGILL